MKDRKTALQHELDWYRASSGKQSRTNSQAPSYVHRHVRSRIKDVLWDLGCRSGAMVLDLGIGTGHEVPYIKRVTDRIIGVDISSIALRTCKRDYGVHCIVADIEQLPFASGLFDFVVIVGVLHHLVGQGSLEHFIAKIYHLVARGGWVVAFEPNLFFLNGPAMVLAQKLRPGMFRFVPHEMPLSPLVLRNLFCLAQLQNVKIEAASFVYNRFPSWLSKFVANREDGLRTNWLLKHFGWWTVVYGQRLD